MTPDKAADQLAALERELGPAGYVDFAVRFADAAATAYTQAPPPARIDLVKRGLTAVQRADQLDPENAAVLKRCAMLTGALAEVGSTIERPVLAHHFKDYMDQALKLTPNDHVLLHMRGRFVFHLVHLSYIERKAALMIGELPAASYELALVDLLRAYETEPTAIDNLLIIGKCYTQLKDYEKARNFLEQIAELEPNDATDEIYAEEATELLKSLPSS
ncbi:unnamed protein product, partial [Mesorhabditis spiculigera]